MSPARLAAGAIVATAALAPVPAAAHAPIPGVGAFWNGTLHPIIVPAHLLALMSVGLAIGLGAPRTSRLALPATAFALAIATALAGPPLPQPAILAVAAGAGLFVALGRPLRLPSLALAVAAAVLVGLDSAPDGLPPGEAWLARTGSALGALAVVVLSGGLATALRLPWQRVAVRTAGSWVAAAALIVLALALSPSGAAS